jgi:lipopolysaccharide biosynthesis glycosyltransferase
MTTSSNLPKCCVFTICAKNYLAHAKTLGYSLRKQDPTCDFYIVLSDSIGDIDIKCGDFTVIESRSLGIPNFEDLAFKYNVIEFSTAVKPFFIDILFKERGYDKVLYIDPDMVVYSPLDFLFDHLNTYSALLTPHIIKPYVDFIGATSEEELLFVGIYNLGFFGISNDEVGLQLTEWWKAKLQNQCFADKEEALHVDQKWMDFLPALYGDKIKILRHSGINLAFWNFHERKLVRIEDRYYVDQQELVILHFSGLVPDEVEKVCRKQTKYTLTNIPEYKDLFLAYVEQLKANDLAYLSALKYTYNFFEDGSPVLDFYRRLYRQLVMDGRPFPFPFSTADGSFYSVLKQNKVMLNGDVKMFSSLKKVYGENPPIVGRVFFMLKLFKKVVGMKNYYLMLRFFRINHKFEKQTYLIEK